MSSPPGYSLRVVVGVGLVAVLATSVSFLSALAWARNKRLGRLKKEFLSPTSTDPMVSSDSKMTVTLGLEGTTNATPPEADIILREQLSRNLLFLGPEKLLQVQNAFVVVVGLGGVGSHAAHMLLRSGITHLRLIDFDQVTLSSLNRHAVATRADVGISKAVCLQQHLLQIIPHAKIDVCVELFSAASADRLLAGNPTHVLDCIDNLETKLDLIQYCKQHEIPILASMGAGCKSDPTRIQIADISCTFEDALARSTRVGLKRRGILSGVPVIYSTEKPGAVRLVELEEEKVDEAHEYAALPNFRSRILPVLGTLPAIFGNMMASFVITELAGWPTEPLAVKHSHKTLVKFYRDTLDRNLPFLLESEKVPGGILLSMQDTAIIFEDTWQGRSCLSRRLDQLCLGKWDVNKPLAFGNVACFTREEWKAHVKRDPKQSLASLYTADIVAKIEARFAKEREWRAML